MKNYTEIKQLLGFEVDKTDDNGLASLTHYLHNYQNGVAHFFEEPATRYLAKLKTNADPGNNFSFQTLLPFQWDIPFPPHSSPDFKFIDLFAGIGGFRLAFQNLGGKCVFTSEINKFARKTYEANFGEVPFGDITQINEDSIPEHDVLCAGFPCQPFSIAGVSKKKSLGREHGFLDATQGTLFFDIARIVEAKRPKTFLLENVKNLVSHDKGNTFKIILDTLHELDYTVYTKVIDGKYFVPQHRERIFFVGFNNQIFKGQEKFSFPELADPDFKVKDILEESVEGKYTLSDKLWSYLQDYASKHKEKGNGFGFGLTDINGITRTISARYYKDGSEVLIPQQGKNPRRLTPRECARLQGYPDTFLIPVSDNQAYRQFGNSVVYPLIHAIGIQIIQVLKAHE
jgi:DNA (cytosine-5)-methyltransferase 1